MALAASRKLERSTVTDWLKQVTLWRRTAVSKYSMIDKLVATGPLGIIVSQVMAIHPVDRNSYFLTTDIDHQQLEWDEIYDLTRREDYPFNL